MVRVCFCLAFLDTAAGGVGGAFSVQQKPVSERPNKMSNSLHLASLIVILAMVGVVASVEVPCTPSTCLGPVVIYFATTDCSGSGDTYQLYNEDPSTFGTCQVESAVASYRIDVHPLFVVHTEVNNPTCDIGLTNGTYTIRQEVFGLCRPRNNQGRNAKDITAISASWIVLDNVNATYASPQPATVVNLNYPNMNRDQYSRRCPTPTNCTLDDGSEPTFIYTDHLQGCAIFNAQGIYNNSYDATCYRVADLYYTSTNCIDEHGYAVRYYVGNGCEYLYSAEYRRNVCGDQSISSYTCRATPMPMPSFLTPSAPSTPPAATPSSPATSALPSVFLLLASIIALLF